MDVHYSMPREVSFDNDTRVEDRTFIFTFVVIVFLSMSKQMGHISSL